MRIASLATLLLASVSLGACATAYKPPEISYDDTPKPAVLQPDPPKPVQIVELPKPLPLPGQLKPLPSGRSAPPEAADPHVRVDRANGAARVQPTRAGYLNAIQVYPFSDGALYQVYAAPGEVTDIALEPGEQLVGSGPVAAGDTVRWIIGDTESGAGPAKRVHILVKPTRPDLVTNLVINTDRRTYHLELHSDAKTYMASVSWAYAQDQLIALRQQNAAADAATPVATGVDLNALNFRYRIEGDNPAWRPLRAFDDGRQVFIEFPSGISQGELPPLWIIGAEGDGQLVNYRVNGNHMIVDRLFAAAELQARRQAPADRAHRPHRREAAVVTDAPREEGGSNEGSRPPEEMRLRSSRPPVTRLSRKVLLGLGTAAAIGIGGALFFALKPQHQTTGSELYNTNNRNTPDGLANLPRDYTGLPKPVPQLGPPLPGDLGRPMANAGVTAPGMPAGTDPEQQRIAQEQEAARVSHLFARPMSANHAAAPTPPPLSRPRRANGGSADLTSQDHKLAFLNGAVDRRTTSPDRVQAPASKYILQAGAVIPAALITGLRSDLPGQVTAQVTEDVYDSPTGKILLIPQGARVIGQYDAQIAFGQTRALLVWNRLIMPNGRSIVLERQPGADTKGYAGLEDEVDNHWGTLFKAAILSTLLSVGRRPA